MMLGTMPSDAAPWQPAPPFLTPAAYVGRMRWNSQMLRFVRTEMRLGLGSCLAGRLLKTVHSWLPGEAHKAPAIASWVTPTLLVHELHSALLQVPPAGVRIARAKCLSSIWHLNLSWLLLPLFPSHKAVAAPLSCSRCTSCGLEIAGKCHRVSVLQALCLCSLWWFLRCCDHLLMAKSWQSAAI